MARIWNRSNGQFAVALLSARLRPCLPFSALSGSDLLSVPNSSLGHIDWLKSFNRSLHQIRESALSSRQTAVAQHQIGNNCGTRSITTTQNKTPFFVHKKDVVLVKPAKAIPSQVLSLSTMDNNPHLELHCQTIHVYEANVHAKADPVSLFKEALSKALVYYYPLAGKVKRFEDGKLQITCDPDDDDGVGVPFLEATSNSDLSSHNHFEEFDAEIVRSFFYEYSPTKGADVNGYYHPLVMQVTKFSCGGFTVAIGLLHAVCDGFAAVQFVQALGELAGGVTELSVKPVWERERLVGSASPVPIQFPEDNHPLATSPFLPSNDMVHAWFNLETETINKLKALYLPKQDGQSQVVDQPLTSLEILGSYIWRARFRALEQNLDGKTVCMLVMGAKHLITPPLPEGYYGNAIVASHAGITGKELVQGPLNEVAKVIKQCKKMGSSVEFVMGSIDFLETVIQHKLEIPLGGATMVLTDWRQLGWCDVADFGWGKPVNMIALPWSMIGHIDSCVIMTPNYKRGGAAKGGARVVLSLPRGAMAKFNEEMEALLKVKDHKN